MNIIGRIEEQNKLNDILKSNKPEFLVVYGRIRIGKTFLIKEFFQNKFSFYATGVLSKKSKTQLYAFNTSLKEYGSKFSSIPENWIEAFNRLKSMIIDNTIKIDNRYNKRIIFLDELP